MSFGPSARPAVLAVLPLLLTACAVHRLPRSAGEGLSQVGIYAGRLQERGESSKPFRLMLFVAPPDRVHGEVLSPLGTPEVVLDGGGGWLAVTLVDEGVTYHGAGSAEALGRVLGLALGPAEWVRAVLTGDTGDPTVRVTRSLDPVGTLPERIAIEAGESRVNLELKRRRPLRGETVQLGTGQPPPGTRILPLDEFVLEGD